MSTDEYIAEQIALEVAKRNLEINALIQEYEGADHFEKLVRTKKVVQDLIEKMRGVDALLLIVGETPQYGPVIEQLLKKGNK